MGQPYPGFQHGMMISLSVIKSAALVFCTRKDNWMRGGLSWIAILKFSCFLLHNYILIWKYGSVTLFEYDNIMMLSWQNKIGLSLKSQKFDVWQHFWLFYIIWFVWWRCIMHHAHTRCDCWSCFFIFIFEIVSNLLNLTK